MRNVFNEHSLPESPKIFMHMNINMIETTYGNHKRKYLCMQNSNSFLWDESNPNNPFAKKKPDMIKNITIPTSPPFSKRIGISMFTEG